ncbi:MAG: hypothetical protein K2X64_07575 [Rhodocyclaceae bacterium]|nr:hypothetical protein [Rhodocyclaceae bacterium]
MIDEAVDQAVRLKYSKLSNLYWQLRACRPWDSASRRRWHRRIRVEKHRLLHLGVPPIEVHLWSRHFVDPRNQNYRDRLNGYYGGNIASRFSMGIGWPTSEARQDCDQKRIELERIKAKHSAE